MKNTLSDLHNHLFAQLERLSDEDLKGDKLKEEIGRAKAVSTIAKDITSNAGLVLEAQKFQFEATGKRPLQPDFMRLEDNTHDKKAVAKIHRSAS